MQAESKKPTIRPAVKRTPDDPEQSKRFIEMAREIKADETEEGADRAFKKVASAPRASKRPAKG
jgi:hypothetical protein